MNIYDLIKRAQELRDTTQMDSVSPELVGKLHEDTLKYINEYQLLASSPAIHKTYASVSAMQGDASPKSDLTGRALVKGQLVVIVPASSTDATAGDVYRYNGPSGNTSGWTYVSKIGGVPADAELSTTSTNPVQNAAVAIEMHSVTSDLNALAKNFLKGKNLFNHEGIIKGQYIKGSNGQVVSYESAATSEFIPVEQGKTYILSGDVRDLETAAGYAEKKYENPVILNTDRTDYYLGLNVPFTVPEGVNYVVLTLGLDSVKTRIMLEEGSVATAYEDYKLLPSPECIEYITQGVEKEINNLNKRANKTDEDIESLNAEVTEIIEKLGSSIDSITGVGTAIGELEAIKANFAGGKNLFNDRLIIKGQYIKGSNGQVVSYESAATSEFIPVEQGKTYILSGDVRDLETAAGYAEKKYENPVILNTDRTDYYLGLNVPFTVPEGVNYVVLTLGLDSIKTRIMLEEGNVATEYEEYQYVPSEKCIEYITQGVEKEIQEVQQEVEQSKKDISSLNKRVNEIVLGGGSSTEPVQGASSVIVDVAMMKKNFVSGKNLFNNQIIVSGKYIKGNTGQVVDYEGAAMSEFIPVEPGKTYIISGDVRDVETAAGYATTEYLDPVILNTARTDYYLGLDVPFTIPEGVNYIAMTLGVDSIVTRIMLEEGSVATEYEDYKLLPSPECIEYITQGVEKEIADANKSISELDDRQDKIEALYTHGKNLINPQRIITGKYVGSRNGAISNYATAAITDFIEVEQGKTYIISGARRDLETAAGYATKGYVNPVILDKSREDYYMSNKIPFTIPEGVNYVVITYGLESFSTQIMLEEGSVATAYEDYKLVTNKGEVERIADIIMASESGFLNKKMAFFGDSSTAPNTKGESWVDVCCSLLGCSSYKNYAKSGSTIRTRYEEGSLAKCLWQQVQTMESEEFIPDVIVIQMGGNDIGDYNNETLKGIYEDFAKYHYLQCNGLGSDATIYSSAGYCLGYLLSEYPDAQILIGTVFQRARNGIGLECEGVANIQRECATSLALPIIEGFTCSGISYLKECNDADIYRFWDGEDEGVLSPDFDHPIYNMVNPSTGEIYRKTDSIPDNAIKMYGRYTWDGTHQNANGIQHVGKFMANAISIILL